MNVADRVKALPSTTFCGRRFTRQQIIQIADTVAACNNLSRQELALTLCEHLEWRTPGNALKVNSALELLTKLESLEICKPPRVKSAFRRRPIAIELLLESTDPGRSGNSNGSS